MTDFSVVVSQTNELQELIASEHAPNVRWLPVAASTGALFREVVRQLAGTRYSLVHAHGISAAVCCSLPAYLRNVPRLVTVHEVFTPGQFTGMRGVAMRAGVAMALSRFDVIHVVTDDAARNMLEYFPSLRKRKNQVRTIPHGIETEHFASSGTRDIRSELSLPRSSVLFGYFGRFMAPKGFRVLTRAVGLLAQKPGLPAFFVVCTGGGGFFREDRRDLETMGLKDRFVFIPFERDLGPTLKGVDAVVMPSLWEASGLLAMEAIVCGVPLIASDCIGLRETTLGTPTRIARTGDAASLAAAMEAELLSPSVRTAREFAPEARRRFDASRSFAALDGVYRELLGESAQ
jgi:glycosyltransferase involved in cell wall biosynthesis